MYLYLVYVCKNLSRNPLRAALTCAAIALTITIYVLSNAVIDGIDRFLNSASQQLRLVVANNGSVIYPLP